jgi:hypothetical protein
MVTVRLLGLRMYNLVSIASHFLCLGPREYADTGARQLAIYTALR